METCSSKLPSFPSCARRGPLAQGLEQWGHGGPRGANGGGHRRCAPLFHCSRPLGPGGFQVHWRGGVAAATTDRCISNPTHRAHQSPPHFSHASHLNCPLRRTTAVQHPAASMPETLRASLNHLFARGREAVNRLSPKKNPPPDPCLQPCLVCVPVRVSSLRVRLVSSWFG